MWKKTLCYQLDIYSLFGMLCRLIVPYKKLVIYLTILYNEIEN